MTYRAITVTVRCIGCRTTRDIASDSEENRRLNTEKSVPLCARCGLPMIAERATAKARPFQHNPRADKDAG